MNGIQLVGDIADILVSGIKSVAGGIGEGLSELAQSVFLTTTGSGSDATTTLSAFGVITVVFAGVGLAIGLSRTVVRMISTLGGHRV